MRRIISSSLALACLFALPVFSNAQCPNGTFVAASTNTFDVNAEGFTGDFSWNNGAGGRLQSTNISAGTTKVLTTPSYQIPNNATQVGFGFELGGGATVTGYTIEALYSDNGVITPITLCSGNAPANGANSYLISIPSQLVGENIRFRITLTVSGAGAQNKSFDNFRTNFGAAQIPLPVHFSSFDARTAASSVKLVWGVDVEENVKNYEVQRSSDGKEYASIGTVNATATSVYTFTDASPLTGNAYYRIKAVDFDGKYMYSTIVSLKGGKSSVVLKAFPMPASSEITIQHGAAARGATLTISAQDGRVVKTIAVSQGTLQTQIDLSTLSTGMYFVQFTDAAAQAQTMKIVKQ